MLPTLGASISFCTEICFFYSFEKKQAEIDQEVLSKSFAVFSYSSGLIAFSLQKLYSETSVRSNLIFQSSKIC